jgi:hypothetical protein
MLASSGLICLIVNCHSFPRTGGERDTPVIGNSHGDGDESTVLFVPESLVKIAHFQKIW